jgi:hypothetical protein
MSDGVRIITIPRHNPDEDISAEGMLTGVPARRPKKPKK